MLAGFIVGFDSDDETIFERQREFIEKAGITWAMAGMLQAPPTTPLYDRMKKEGRLFEDSEATSNFSAPNFRTVHAAADAAAAGSAACCSILYDPKPIFSARSVRSSCGRRALRRNRRICRCPTTFACWPHPCGRRAASPATAGRTGNSSEARAQLRHQRHKLWMGSMVLLSAHHFLIYAREVAEELERDCMAIEARARAEPAAADRAFSLAN